MINAHRENTVEEIGEVIGAVGEDICNVQLRRVIFLVALTHAISVSARDASR